MSEGAAADPGDRHRPKVITKSDPTALRIEWADGASTELSAVQLRGICPCARCVDEHSGVRRYDPATTPPDIETRNVALVGHYALSIGFSDGHDTGIFTYRQLRELGLPARDGGARR